MAKSVEQAVVPTTVGTVHTIAAASRLAYLHVRLCNTGNTSRLPSLHLVPSGGSADDTNKILGHAATNPLKAKATHTWLLTNLYLAAGYTIQWKIDAGSDVGGAISIDQIPASDAYVDIEPLELPASDTAAQFGGSDYQVSTNKIIAAGSLVLYNNDTVDREATVYLVHNGDSSGVKNTWVNVTLKAGETQEYQLDELVPALAKIRWVASAANAITAKLSVYEESL